MTAMPLIAPLFIEDQDHESVLTMINEIKATVHVTVVAKSIDGSVIAQQLITFPGHTQQVLRVRDLLGDRGAEQAIGSLQVVPNPMEVQSMAVAAQLSITSATGPFTRSLEEELESPDPGMPSTYRVVVPPARTYPLLALVSTSAGTQKISLTCLHSGRATTRQTLALPPGRLVLTRACQAGGSPLLTDAGTATLALGASSVGDRRAAFAVEASSTAEGGGFAIWGMATVSSGEADTAVALNFTDARAMRSPSMVFAGVPIGATDLLGGEVFRPEMAVANFGDKPTNLVVSYSSMLGGEPQVRNATSLTLRPGVVQTLALPELSGDPAMRNSFVVSSDAAPGQVVSNLVSCGQQMYPAVQLIGKDGQDTNNGGGHPWTIGDGDQSTLLLFNHADKPIIFNVNVSAAGVMWHEEYNLAARETRAVDIAEIIRKQVPDRRGSRCPPTATKGEVSWFTVEHGDGTGRLIVSNAQIGLARNFSCGYNLVLCGSYLDTSVSGFGIGSLGYLGAVEPNICDAFDPTACSGNAYESGGGGYSYSWTSSNNSVAPVYGSTGNPGANFYGQAIGAATGFGKISSSSCSFQSPGQNVVVDIRPGQFNGSCNGTTANSATMDVTFAQGVVLSSSGTSLDNVTATGNVDVIAGSEDQSVSGQDAFGKFKYYAGPGTSGTTVGHATVPLMVNATSYGLILVKPTIPVVCQ